jgi:hypothetical protein
MKWTGERLITDMNLGTGVIDHLHRYAFASSIVQGKKVLNKNGIRIISTPKKNNYNTVDPDNPFHLKELTGNEFESLLSKYFPKVEMFGQSFLISSALIPYSSSQKITFFEGDF